MKKFIAFISTLALTVNLMVVPAATAAAADNADKIQLLKGLGVIDVVNLQYYAFINRGPFLNAVSKLLFDYDTDPESAARTTGMISVNDEFVPDEYMPVHEAVKYAVIALGYKVYADKLGGDESAYMNEAQTLGLLEGVFSAKDEMLTRDDAVAILYNMLEIEPFSQYYNGSDDKGYVTRKNETLLSINRNIEKIEGLVGKNSRTSMDQLDGCGKNSIEINGVLYDTTYSSADNFLGRYVTAYVKYENNGDGTVLYIQDKKNKNVDLIINGRDIQSVAEDYSYIEYEDQNSFRYKKAKISTTPSVIYNGKFYSEYTVEDLTPKAGELKLLDNNNDGVYEMITIISAYTMVVDTVSANPEEIYNKITLPGSKKMLDLSNAELTYDIFLNGAAMPVTALGKNYIASVAVSKDGKYLLIHASSTQITDVLNTVSMTEQTITIGGTEYNMTDEFAEWYQLEAGEPAKNQKYTFYLDAFGNVAFMLYTPASNHMLYLKAYEDDVEEIYSIKYMDTAGVWSTDPLAKNVTVNGTKYAKEVAYSEIKDLKPQVVVIEKNSKGEIKTFKTAIKQTKSTKIDDFTYFEINNQAFEFWVSGFGGQVYYNGASRLFLLPDFNSKNEEDYSVTPIGANFFAEWVTYTLNAYDRDEFLTAPVFSIVYNDSVHYERGKHWKFFVTGISEICDENDEVRPVLKGVFGSNLNYQLIGATDDVFSKKNIKVGDLVYFTLDTKGHADYVSDSVGNIFDSADKLENKALFSTVVSTDPAGSKVKFTTADVDYVRVVDQNCSIKFYDLKSGKIRLGRLNELRPGQRILCTIDNYKITDMTAAE